MIKNIKNKYGALSVRQKRMYLILFTILVGVVGHALHYAHIITSADIPSSYSGGAKFGWNILGLISSYRGGSLLMATIPFVYLIIKMISEKLGKKNLFTKKNTDLFVLSLTIVILITFYIGIVVVGEWKSLQSNYSPLLGTTTIFGHVITPFFSIWALIYIIYLRKVGEKIKVINSDATFSVKKQFIIAGICFFTWLIVTQIYFYVVHRFQASIPNKNIYSLDYPWDDWISDLGLHHAGLLGKPFELDIMSLITLGIVALLFPPLWVFWYSYSDKWINKYQLKKEEKLSISNSN